MKHTIAAIIPLYNGAAFIEEAVRSVLLQSRAADEIIVVDDGSTDNGAGAAIVRRIAATDPSIRLLIQSNGGQGSARNFGVANATSDLIALLDQDDAWYPNHLERLEEFFAANESERLGWVYSNLDRVDEDGELLAESVLHVLSNTQHPKTTLEGCLRGDMFILPGASLISRQAFDSVGGFDPQFVGYEDDDLFLRMFVAGYTNAYLDEPLTIWRTHTSNTSSTEKMSISRRRYYEKVSKDYPDFLQSTIVPRFASIAFQDFIFNTNAENPDRAKRAQAEMKYFSAKLPVMKRARYLLAIRIFFVTRNVTLRKAVRLLLPRPLRLAAMSIARRV